MIKLPAIFKEHMVLQRNKNIRVWGESQASFVTVSLSDISVTVKVIDGKFMAILPAFEAGGPYMLKVVEGEMTGDGVLNLKDNVIIGDVMIGEVWIACGQSNMELELQNSYMGKEVMEKADNKLVRYYYTPKMAYECQELEELKEKSEWELCNKDYANPEHMGKWSTVAYYYADKLSKELNVTVGIINANWGGTHAYCWMSREKLVDDNHIKRFMDEYDEITKDMSMEQYLKDVAYYEEYQAGFDKRCGEYYATHENPSWDECIELCGENMYPGPVGPRSFVRPAGLYDVILSQIIPYTIAGGLYYQGEEDDQTPEAYYYLLRGIVEQWREDFMDENLPFLIVQLPMFKNACDGELTNWSEIREAQYKVFDTVKNTGIAIITDLGELNNIHPTFKEKVGERLCLQALYGVYGKISEKEAFGPMYKDYRVDSGKMIFTFKNAEDGFIVKTDNEGKVEGEKLYSSYLSEDDKLENCFELAGCDGEFHKADSVTIEGSTITVSSKAVPCPCKGRFNWRNYEKVMLYGKNMIPVAPFRTCV
ncbi:MAG: sialate O-acetylesterase [Lachnospiraceae bacterium]|nr:sialate O-acetylesterase [Lachnospiraceae bacterium]